MRRCLREVPSRNRAACARPPPASIRRATRPREQPKPSSLPDARWCPTPPPCARVPYGSGSEPPPITPRLLRQAITTFLPVRSLPLRPAEPSDPNTGRTRGAAEPTRDPSPGLNTTTPVVIPAISSPTGKHARHEARAERQDTSRQCAYPEARISGLYHGWNRPPPGDQRQHPKATAGTAAPKPRRKPLPRSQSRHRRTGKVT